MAEDTSKKQEKKSWSEAERLELAEKLDAELDDYINNLEKKSYTEGWPEDKWQEEMEKHPFFMKNAPNPGDELSPLMEGLQQLKYSAEENSPEELANNYKEDGNFNYKYKKYRLAIISYTEGIRTKCKDTDLLAQLYNNRAAANFMLENYRSCLSDCKEALKLKPKYPKALSRAANCYFKIKDYTRCIEICDQILEEAPTDKSVIKLKSEAITEKKRHERDLRKQDVKEKKYEKQEEKVLRVILSRKIKLDSMSGKGIAELKDLEPQVPQIAQNVVHLDGNEKLIWPVMILYPEVFQTDFIQNFHEDSTFEEQLEELFKDPPPWDMGRKYSTKSVNVYFEGHNKMSVNKIDIRKTLCQILQDDRFIIRGGTPSFLVLPANSEAEKRLLANY
ncbi:DNA polymerase interacting tetratricopeptide repeat-containing, protein of 47 kDa [Belonocnema kinseyi]|uniref:DNA polymerase interacting tetratricopeptide repeat-containing, protein of 47 kDa n=1 Tax=Belonocnema kinseyi TaxID=2817044 RepID=UPI00143DDC96|nr:DNA polymerase interacting tetratricopeptide repeat-containing, protein of 47 kDa [Belonocnema kinseyi]XP_033214608.1 DNA polymerase interacting tetratricopeptide repeat-containing, protein of 47 kDa [Belonocnema kinseyi]